MNPDPPPFAPLDAAAVSPALADAEKLQLRGLCFQAYQALRAAAPDGDPQRLTRTADRILAARIVQHCGAPDLCSRLIRRAYHVDRAHPAATYYYARRLLERRGPLASLRFQERKGELADAPGDIRADWLGLRAITFAALRDFTRATDSIDRARALAPNDAWLWVEQAVVFQAQDRYAQALAATGEALKCEPNFRPAMQCAAELHQLLGDDQAALDLLRRAGDSAESIFVLLQLFGLEFELAHYPQAKAALERLRAIAPLMEPDLDKWLRFRAFDIASAAGDYPAALELGAGLDDDFCKKTVERLQEYLAQSPLPPADVDNNPGVCVRLPVGFVRQHRLTCVPATLTTLCRYWDRPAEHLSIAAKICYDGTPHHKERAWADDAGLLTREFTLTWETGVRLIDRRVPFIITTVAPEHGHAQAVIGYNALRRTFLIRDPYSRGANEFVADKTLEFFRSTGPRCLLILPPEHAARLDGIDLSEAPLYDHLYALQIALERHDRETARLAGDALVADAPGHRITLYARRCLASYDASRTGVLAATDELLKLYPDDSNLLLSRLWSLRDLARRQDRVDLLQAVCSKKGANPVFWQRLAEEIQGDAREAGRAVRFLERCIRRNPHAAAAYTALAGALWDQRRFQDAFLLYRFAACIDNLDERFAQSYFIASRHLRKTDEALQFLRDRFAALGSQSGAPARTLLHALVQLNREPEAFDILDQALALRPDDPDILLFAANNHVRYGKFDRGLELLQRAKPLAHPMGWLHAAAQIEDLRCRLPEALAHWQEIARTDPLFMDAHASIARLLAETAGRAKSIEYLEALTARFPHHFGIHTLLISWQRHEDPEARLATINRLIDIDPGDAWAHRELAMILCEQGFAGEAGAARQARAFAAAEQGHTLEPLDDRTFNTLLRVHETSGRLDEAREIARQALRNSVDNQLAAETLVQLAPSTEQRRAQLQFIKQELIRQVILGEALLTFRRLAATVLDPEEVAALLKDAHAARPDLWQAWSALITQLISMNDLPEVQRLATQAVERFPLVPRLWVDLAAVYAGTGEFNERIAALEEALAIIPAWSYASRLLAAAHESRNDLPAACRALEQAVARDPLDPWNHAFLASVLWKLDRKKDAIERLEHSLLLHPDDQRHWDLLHYWGTQQKRPLLALEKLREMTRLRAGDAGAWSRLARVLPPENPEALQAAEKARDLEPRNAEHHDLCATILSADPPRWDEARAACRPAIFGDALPPMLQARSAWLLNRRGRTADAIAAMRDVLRMDQSNPWAWRQLAEWLHKTGDLQEYLNVARRMVDLWPAEPSFLEILAHALLALGGPDNRTAAEKALRRALELDPDRSFAAETLFDLQLEDKKLVQAESTLKFIQNNSPPTAGIQRVRLALADGSGQAAVNAAVAAANDLFAAPDTLRHHVERLREVARFNRNAGHQIDRALVRAVHSGKCNPEVAPMAIPVLAANNQWKEALQIVRNAPSGSPMWVEACRQYFITAGRARRLRDLNRLVKLDRKSLHANIQTWGVIGYAYLANRRWKDAIRWLGDYESRANIEPWMLLNLATSFIALRKFEKGAQIHRRAAALPVPDNSTGNHLVRLAVLRPDLFTPGARSPASAPAGPNFVDRDSSAPVAPFTLDGIDVSSFDIYDKLLLAAARVTLFLTAQKTARAKPAADFLPLWKAFLKQIQPPDGDFPTVRFVRRTCLLALRSAPSLSIRLQALRQFLALLTF